MSSSTAICLAAGLISDLESFRRDSIPQLTWQSSSVRMSWVSMRGAGESRKGPTAYLEAINSLLFERHSSSYPSESRAEMLTLSQGLTFPTQVQKALIHTEAETESMDHAGK